MYKISTRVYFRVWYHHVIRMEMIATLQNNFGKLVLMNINDALRFSLRRCIHLNQRTLTKPRHTQRTISVPLLFLPLKFFRSFPMYVNHSFTRSRSPRKPFYHKPIPPYTGPRRVLLVPSAGEIPGEYTAILWKSHQFTILLAAATAAAGGYVQVIVGRHGSS